MHKRATLSGAAMLVCGLAVVASSGCGDASVLFFNPSAVNQVQGGLFPLVPEQRTGLLLVRVVNSTPEPILFLVTIERGVVLDDGNGNGDGDAGVVSVAQTSEVFTQPGAQASEAGVLFDCSDEQPIARVGLGQNLNQPQTDAGLFVGGAGDVVQGFGVPANINPLSRAFNDFQCGDTVIFQAIESTNAPGGFKVQAFVIPHELHPDDTGRNTFQVAADFLREEPGS